MKIHGKYLSSRGLANRGGNMVDLMCNYLGVRVGEEWLGGDGKLYRILSDGHIQSLGRTDVWSTASLMEFIELLSGELTVRWLPDLGEVYFIPDVGSEDMYEEYIFTQDDWEYIYYERGLIFKTRLEAIECTEKMLDAIK